MVTDTNVIAGMKVNSSGNVDELKNRLQAARRDPAAAAAGVAGSGAGPDAESAAGSVAGSMLAITACENMLLPQ